MECAQTLDRERSSLRLIPPSTGSALHGTSRPSPSHDQPSALDVVDPDLLIPPDRPTRGGSRPDAAFVLDRELGKLSGMDAHCRLVQATLVRRLMDHRLWKSLGFARLADYARERLGCSPRSLEVDAQVLGALDSLPRIRRALESGVITWTQARLLARIATPETEALLLEKSAHLTTRELERLVRSDGSSASARQEAAAGTSTREEDEDSEPYVRWTTSISPTGRRMWRATREFASRCAGTPLSAAQVLELVVAEAASGSPNGDAGNWMPTMQQRESRLLSQQRHDEARGRQALECFLAEAGVIDGFSELTPVNRDAGPAARLNTLLSQLETADAFEIDRRLREARRAAQRIDYQLAALLRIGSDRRLFRELGFATVKLYVESRLGFSARRVWSLIAIDRESWRSGMGLREAWREGRISHLAACTIIPVVSERHAEAWIRRAGEVTLRRLADEVAWALEQGDPDGLAPHPGPPPPGTDVRTVGLASVDLHEVQMRAHGQNKEDNPRAPGGARLVFGLPVSVAALLETVLGQYHQAGETQWLTFERVVAHALLEWTSAPRHRDPIFERDGWRCSVPGCSSRRNLHDHHVVFRSQGSDNSRENRITVCAAHHLHGIHVGVVRVEGAAPADLAWQLGCRGGGEPLLRLHGERYAA